jgi:type II secretory pathway pseudopilin PulG
LVKDEYRYIEPVSIIIISTAIISALTGAGSAIQKGKQNRQQLARLATQGISQEEAMQLSEIESRRNFLTNIFNAQQKIIQEDEKAYKKAETLKKISISFLVLTLILGSVWLARKKM